MEFKDLGASALKHSVEFSEFRGRCLSDMVDFMRIPRTELHLIGIHHVRTENKQLWNFWNLCIDFCSPHQSCVFVLIRGGGMFFVLPNLKRQPLIRKMYSSYFLLQVTKIRWAGTQKFSPGSVPEPNHTKTLNMRLVNSYFSSHICLNQAPF